MSTNWQYTPVSSGDADSVSRNEQQEPTQSVDSLKDTQERSQPDWDNALKRHKEDASQTTFINATKGDTLQIPNWPEPRKLEVTRGKSILSNLGSILFLVPPLFFLGLVLSAIGLHSKEASAFGGLVIQACLLGPTVFPLMFSAILGWCLRTYGRYKSERGVKLGELERLIGSQTVFSFLRFALIFKQLDQLCIMLGILWTLSPLGGQSILRMLSVRQVDLESTETISYLDPYSASEYHAEKNIPLTGTMVTGLYVASIYASPDIKNRTTDVWGAVKIPSIESINFNHQDDDGVAVGDVSSYTSLIGIPIGSTTYKTVTNYTFTLNATTFTTQCQEPKTIDGIDVPYPADGGSFVLETQFIPPRPYTITVTERNISLITFSPGLSYAVIHNCTLVPNFLLAKVECTSGHCGVTRIKKLEYSVEKLPPSILGQDTWPDIVRELPRSTHHYYVGHSSQTELYLYNPQQLKPNISSSQVDLREVPIAEFSRRFATVINTYYQATLSPELRMQSLVSDDPSMVNFLKTTEATIHNLSPNTYQRHWEWAISALVASLAMLGVAITSILLENRVISPDTYGYISSMTRDNPYFPLPPNGCTLEGTERAVLLRNVVVRVEDVAPNKEVGHIAFTMAGYKTPTEQETNCRLRRTKVYSGGS
ncbi:hypothetical protein CPB86DRAFT_788342 [Serendipita vermifera]|nr:hypothetical protein CPB86DRAFT_788342 [Serendipita vermifera]